MCLGLRRSEIAGLPWLDFDWSNQEVFIQRSVIANRVDAVKTRRSKARLPLNPALITALQSWLRLSEFDANAGLGVGFAVCCWRDVVLPQRCAAQLHYPGWQARRPGHSRLAHVSPHVPHMERHADIKTTMNVYGGSMPEAMRAANSQVVGMAIQPRA